MAPTSRSSRSGISRSKPWPSSRGAVLSAEARLRGAAGPVRVVRPTRSRSALGRAAGAVSAAVGPAAGDPGSALPSVAAADGPPSQELEQTQLRYTNSPEPTQSSASRAPGGAKK
jgi:hypothetical protein